MGSFTRTQREHGARPFGGHLAGTCGAEAPAPPRLPLSASPARPSRNPRHLFPGPQEGDLRPRLLLAPARRVPADHDTEDAPIVLDGEVPRQRGARPRESERPRRARMERPGHMGVRNRGSGDACVTPCGFPRPRGGATGADVGEVTPESGPPFGLPDAGRVRAAIDARSASKPARAGWVQCAVLRGRLA